MKKSKTILLCDDNQVILFMLKKLITTKSDNLAVVTALNGLDGLKIINNQPIDYLITDIEMPVMNGWELIESVQKNGFDMKKVIVISAMLEQNIIPYAERFAILKYYSKPIMPEDIDEITALINA